MDDDSLEFHVGFLAEHGARFDLYDALEHAKKLVRFFEENLTD